MFPNPDDDSCDICGGIDYCHANCPRGRAPGDAQMDDTPYDGEIPAAPLAQETPPATADDDKAATYKAGWIAGFADACRSSAPEGTTPPECGCAFKSFRHDENCPAGAPAEGAGEDAARLLDREFTFTTVATGLPITLTGRFILENFARAEPMYIVSDASRSTARPSPNTTEKS